MNNSINSTSPNFGAKVNLEEIAGRLKGKNPDAIKKFVETGTKDYPKDSFDFIAYNNGDVKMFITGAKGIEERALILKNADFNKLIKTTSHNIADTFKLACEILKDAITMDKKTTKEVNIAIKKGKIIEDSPEMDRMIEKADDKVAKYVKEMLEDDEVLSKAKFL